MDILFEHLEHYSELIGQGRFSLVIVLWILGILLIAMIAKCMISVSIFNRSNKKSANSSLNKLQLFGISTIEYLFDAIVAFIMISLFRSDDIVWNYIVAPGIGFIAGFFAEIYLVAKYGNKIKSSRDDSSSNTSKTSTSVTNITITNNELGDEPEMNKKPLSDIIKKFKKPNSEVTVQTSSPECNSSLLQSELPGIEQAIQELASGLVSTIEVVQDIATQMSELRKAIDKIEDHVEDINDSVNKIHEETAEDAAIQCRVRILRFNIDLIVSNRNGETLPKDLFEQTLIDIDNYDKYCQSHPNFKNKITAAAERYILAEYDRCMESGFLMY